MESQSTGDQPPIALHQHAAVVWCSWNAARLAVVHADSPHTMPNATTSNALMAASALKEHFTMEQNVSSQTNAAATEHRIAFHIQLDHPTQKDARNAHAQPEPNGPAQPQNAWVVAQ